jgi:surface carbohydrate biosynthesis protein
MKKIVIFIKLLFKLKFIFRTPKKHDIIILDQESEKALHNCTKGLDSFVLPTRINQIKEIYLSYAVLKFFCYHFFRGSPYTIYLASLIEVIRPKVLITIIDNDLKTSSLAKILSPKFYFMAIQNACRYDLLESYYISKTKNLKKTKNNKLFIPNFFCFGDYEKDLYEKLNINTHNFFPTGDLRWANFLDYLKTSNDDNVRYKSDICLISEYASGDQGNKVHQNDTIDLLNTYPDIEKGFGKIVKYTIKFCIKNSMKLIFACKRDKKKNLLAFNQEINFFKKNLTKEEFTYLEKNMLLKNVDNYSSQRAVANSQVAVGITSTLLRDKLSYGGKILSCNLTKHPAYKFPLHGICSLDDCNYEQFEKRLLELYLIDHKNFLTQIEKKPDYLMKFNTNNSTINKIRMKLEELILN